MQKKLLNLENIAIKHLENFLYFWVENIIMLKQK